MYFNILTISLFAILAVFQSEAQEKPKDKEKKETTIILKPYVREAPISYDDFKELVVYTEEIRANRLVDFDTFLKMQQEENTIVLDTRSREKYGESHIEGAINLPFTEFTHDNLRKIIPNTKTRILIYCNNNIDGDPINFASKISPPALSLNVNAGSLTSDQRKKSYSLALNIPSYINLVGYGYENIYELKELVSVGDRRLKLVSSDSKAYDEVKRRR